MDAGTFKKLNPAKRPAQLPGLVRPSDVARVEDRTFICSEEGRCRPHQQLDAPAEMRATLQPLFDGCMKGRTMYVVRFQHGPAGLPIAHIGIGTDRQRLRGREPRLMTRMGKAVYRRAGHGRRLRACMHTGAPLAAGEGQHQLALQPM